MTWDYFWYFIALVIGYLVIFKWKIPCWMWRKFAEGLDMF